MLKVEVNGPVTTLTLDRPEVRNALSRELIDALLSAIDGLSSSCRVAIIQGAGKSFCAGGDLEWMKKAANYTYEQNEDDANEIAYLFHSIASCPPVTIARIHGHAFGGGGGIAAAADCVVASKDAVFSFSEVKLGLIPATISPYVIDKIGRGHARTLFTTGVQFSAQRAYEVGLVSHICEFEELDGVVNSLVTSILTCGPVAISDSRKLCFEPLLGPEESGKRLARARTRPEALEGIASFLERRKASFVVANPLENESSGEGH